MKSNDIDNLFKRGIVESELRSEQQLLDAKSRVWDAIQKPKPKSRQHWLLMSSIAAAVSMFVIASILFLKLDSKQKELGILQAEVYTKISPIQENGVIKSIEPNPDRDEEIKVLPNLAPAIPQEIAIEDTESKSVEAETTRGKAEPLPQVETPKMDLIVHMDPMINLPHDIGLEQVEMPKASPASVTTSTLRKRGKIKLKIGNSHSPYQDNQNSLALNIKL